MSDMTYPPCTSEGYTLPIEGIDDFFHYVRNTRVWPGRVFGCEGRARVHVLCPSSLVRRPLSFTVSRWLRVLVSPQLLSPVPTPHSTSLCPGCVLPQPSSPSPQRPPSRRRTLALTLPRRASATRRSSARAATSSLATMPARTSSTSLISRLVRPPCSFRGDRPC